MKGFTHKKGFKIITMSPGEAKMIGFGIPEGCLCMHCNTLIKGTIYYIPVLNASGRNTFHYLTTTEFFNYMSNPTYQLEQLMFTEQMHHSNIFISSALALQKNAPDHISSYLLQCIVS